MKKTLAILLVLVMALSLAACGDNDSKKDGDDGKKVESQDKTDGIKVDMSKYPSDINKWTAQNYLDYFKEAVKFPSDADTWFQDHENYWSGLPIYEVAGIWNDEGTYSFEVYVFNPDSPDTTAKEVDELKKHIKDAENHEYVTDELFLSPATHMFERAMFSYEYVLDEDLYNAVDAAYKHLVATFKVTPEF